MAEGYGFGPALALRATELNGTPVTYPAPLHDPQARGFASDNYAGIHP